jgi:ankyrin repeat domain-containing protein 50
MDELVDDFNTSPSLEYVAGIVAKVLSRERIIRCLIDGLDECPIPEALEVLRWIKRLRAELCLHCCLAVRSSAHKGLVTEGNLGEWTSIEMPDNNPDIIKYINDEMQDCIETSRLKIGDPLIAIEIRDTLLRGANGM